MKSRWAPLLVAALISLPALQGGFVLDDWFQRATVRRDLAITPQWDLFTFADGNPATMEGWVQRGPFPWFTLPELRLRFFRPLSSALIIFDTLVFGDVGWPQHLHSTLWYVALTALVAALFRRRVPGVAWLAALLFAVDDAHVFPVSWLANRNAMVAVTFAWLGLWAHLRWREEQWRPGLFLSVLAYATALAAGETAVAGLAYVVAYELVGRDDAWKTKVRALLPATLSLGVFAVIYKLVGAGARGSATYIDPLGEPLHFLANAPIRFLALLGGQSTGLPPDMWLSLPVLRPVLVVAGVLALGVWPFVWRRWAPTDPTERRNLAWLGLGAFGSMLPTLATFPAARLLTAASFGLAPIIATLLLRAWADTGWRRWLGVAWLGFAFAVQPVTSWLTMAEAFTTIGRRTVEATLAAKPEKDARFIVVSSTDFAPAIYAVPLFFELHLPVPRSWHLWSFAPLAHRLERTGERTFELEVLDGHFAQSVFEQNFRSEGHPFHEGDRVALDGEVITVSKVDDGLARAIHIELLEAPEAFHFVRWDGDTLVPFVLPAVGETVVLPKEQTMFERLILGPKS